MQGEGEDWECPEKSLIFSDQFDAELLGACYKLAVVSGTEGCLGEPENMSVLNFVFAAR
jgi:hypothetical protein